MSLLIEKFIIFVFAKQKTNSGTFGQKAVDFGFLKRLCTGTDRKVNKHKNLCNGLKLLCP